MGVITVAKRKHTDDEPPKKPIADERIVMNNNVGIPVDEHTAKMICAGIVEPLKIKFLLNLAVLGNRTRAAKATGMHSCTVWVWRREDDSFRKAYVRAMECAGELHEDEMWRRASEGVLEPVYQGGELVGSVRKFSDSLLMFALKGAMPGKYAERSKVEHSGHIEDSAARLRAARERALKKAKK